MGEYATYHGHKIKIGTCESMYYLRADQATLVKPLPGNVDPIKDAAEIRFRFPFPDEDETAPGTFDPFDRAIYLSGITAPESVEHYSVQFSALAGYLVSLPCPESKDSAWVRLLNPEEKPIPITIHRNGFPGAVGICQQRLWNGKLVLVARCGGCGSLWRYPELKDAEPLIAACRAETDRLPVEGSRAKFFQTIADRITTGYTQPLPF
jgi:hypothetical protein